MRNYFRFSLISGEEQNLEQFDWWLDKTHFHAYPKTLFNQKKETCDRFDIDAILSGKHFSVRSLKQAIIRQNSQFQLQPGFISIRTDEAVQYDPQTNITTKLLDPHFKKYEKRIGHVVEIDEEEKNNYPIRLLSTGITNCHTVVIHDDRNQFLMLHVSPAAVKKMNDNPFFSSIPKKAYLDIQSQYNDPNLGVQKNSTIDVVVVDNGGYFNKAKFVRMLPENVIINSLQIIKPELAQRQSYSVCFLPNENKLITSAYNHFIEYENIFKPIDKAITMDLSAQDQDMQIGNYL
ncbi:Uncharacterised protein [Legionella busanensis]|uniref:Uncharacterized protein n=1 Tax=Legionella busanensis TaxID=190655 RepID=A0A378JQA2_9GAMM|nr:hypothetical protein [Legionella busanensis]STX52349.1 Uncharacterised protein [Legionella busanensis]